MKSLRLMILLFALAATACLGVLMLHAYRSLDAEEAATLGFFAEALFDEMEATAAALVRREEARPVDAYAAPPATGPDALRELPAEDFIRGYFQNNPDGSLQTPHQAPGRLPAAELAARLAELADANRLFNGRRAEGTDRLRPLPVEEPREERRQDQERFAGQYLDSTRSRQAKSYLGERDSRREKVTPEQAYNIARPGSRSSADSRAGPESVAEEKAEDRAPAASPSTGRAPAAPGAAAVDGAPMVQAEVAPFQSVFLDRRRVFIFRRVVIDGRMYRQGFVLRLDDFLAHLTRAHFTGQPLARFAHLRLRAIDQGVDAAVVDAGPPADRPLLNRSRTFPPPFGFLRATLASDSIPAAPGRSTLTLALAALAVVILGGLVAIYHVSRRIVDYSERRARFVASVTHELKTPLTNIRMYIEMLEQGMARDPEREQAYFRILHSESARLSRLIGNVLELSKLERRQRRPALAERHLRRGPGRGGGAPGGAAAAGGVRARAGEPAAAALPLRPRDHGPGAAQPDRKQPQVRPGLGRETHRRARLREGGAGAGRGGRQRAGNPAPRPQEDFRGLLPRRKRHDRGGRRHGHRSGHGAAVRAAFRGCGVRREQRGTGLHDPDRPAARLKNGVAGRDPALRGPS